MILVNKNKAFSYLSTKAKFQKVKNNKGLSKCLGMITVYEAFVTRKPITLHAKTEPVFYKI